MTELFKGRLRMIFALLGGIVFILLKWAFPELPFGETETILFFGLIGAYILGEGLSGKTLTDSLPAVLKSQKFIALFAGILVTTIKAFFPTLAISDVELTGLIASFILFIIGAGTQKPAEPQG